MAKVVQLESAGRSVEPSSLTPELKEFIDRVIVPILVKQYLEESQLAEEGDVVAKSSSSTTALPTKVRP